jgi:hypothetical protein
MLRKLDIRHGGVDLFDVMISSCFAVSIPDLLRIVHTAQVSVETFDSY